MDKEKVIEILDYYKEIEEGISKDEMKTVMIEKAANLKLLCDYVVSCSYGDIVLIICMLHDYVNMLDQIKGNDIQYQAYYREKFTAMADRLAEQIEYDYEATLKKCKKKQEKEERNSDIGEDAMVLAVKREQPRKRSKEGEVQTDHESNSKVSGE